MERSLHVLLVSTSPIVATVLQYWLESGSAAFQCRILDPAVFAGSAFADGPSIVLAMPQHWSEMARWLPSLRGRFSQVPWLIHGDLRLAGMFWSSLETQLCTLVPPDASPEELRMSLLLLSRQRALHPLPRLVEPFCGEVAPLPGGEPEAPTPRELQCGCAVSFGLDNRRIAELLHLGEGTVKGHVHQLLRKLHVARREDLAGRIERTLARSFLTFR